MLCFRKVQAHGHVLEGRLYGKGLLIQGRVYALDSDIPCSYHYCACCQRFEKRELSPALPSGQTPFKPFTPPWVTAGEFIPNEE